MAEVKLRALGLREVDFGDYDRYLTALTADGRRIEILCKKRAAGKKAESRRAAVLLLRIHPV